MRISIQNVKKRVFFATFAQPKKINAFMKTFRYALLSCLLFAIPLLGMAQQTGYFLHTISKGQSLYSIAAMYNVTIEEIISLNPGSEKMIKAGDTLKIPQAQASSRQQFHTIQPGETLYRLTQLYHVPAQQICEANPGLTATNFRAGQVIVIPEAKADTPSAVSPTTVPQVSQSAMQARYQDMHKVKRKETIFSICKAYGITRQELIDANPELKTEPLKKGKFLRIPFPKVPGQPGTVQKLESEQPARQPSDTELFTKTSKKDQRLDKVKVAVILPFMLDNEASSEQKRMVEYYEGFLMAVDSLKRDGYSFDIHTYDSNRSNVSIKGILARPEMKEMNLIIGPVHPDHIKEAAAFAKKNEIRMIVPFSSKDNDVFNNPYIYQINTPQSYLYSEVYDHFIRCFRNNVNIIFVDTQDGNTEKADFIKGLKIELDAQRTPYKQLTIRTDTPVYLENVINPAMENLFIPTSGSNIALIKLLPHLKQLALESPECSLHMFGYPEWQTYTTDYITDFYAFDTYFYGSFYTNNLSQATADFQYTFRKWYGKTIMNTYPKYAILGFDTGYYFLKGLSMYGNNLEANLGKIRVSPIQTSFKFERVNNWGGFINKKVFFVHFTKGHELIKMDFDK